MTRTLVLASLLAAGLSGAAFAQAFPTDKTGEAKNGGLSRSQALYKLMDGGYSNVGTLKNVDGTWTGEATKGGTNMVTVGKDGKITAKKL